jgi:hypothetical protein
MTGPAGYRPYHAASCPARDPAVNVDTLRIASDGTIETARNCTCGGLEHPQWNPGDNPVTAEIQVIVPPGVQAPLREWLATRGQYLFPIPLENDPLPTFGIGAEVQITPNLPETRP